MNQTQKCILLIASEIDRICKLNDIKYSMIGGTMIGAVRHSGFIPWDDDIDFAMTRQEFERFLVACEKDLNENFQIQTETNEEGYAFSFCKVLLKGTYCCDAFSENASISRGIWVDVFPLDNLPEKTVSRVVLKAKNTILKNLIWVKCGYGEKYQKKQIRYYLYLCLGYPFSIQRLKSRRRKLLSAYNNTSTSELFLSDYPYIKFYSKWFESFKEFAFENCTFSGIVDYDQYLKMQFGDYMRVPPPEERKSHPIKNIDYGPYKNIE